MIQPDRVHHLNATPIADRALVIYWMQAAQRTSHNYALEYAISEANRLGKPLIVYFGLTDTYPGANLRHYTFMIEGLKETAKRLAKREMQFVFVHADPADGLRDLFSLAALIVTDLGYTRIQRKWREEVAAKAPCSVVAVESEVVVPVQTVCPKEAWSAAVIRRRIEPLLSDYLAPLPQSKVKRRSIDFAIDHPKRIAVETALENLEVDRSVAAVTGTTGGYTQARRRLEDFIEHKLKQYAERRNDPCAGMTSGLSPYLHFGQVSPVEIALEIKKSYPKLGREFLEELIVRRELSMNFVWYNTKYDLFDCLPAWAKSTLHAHARDKREYIYSRPEWESASTHDPYWNSAQKELLLTGRIHGYMRMYWGKKILEWSRSPEEAYETAVYLNDKYQLDGRDPNGYAGVAWCFGKHDRPWAERPVFGMVRYMNDKGLKRKFEIDSYVAAIAALER